jgi:hypothetical protein
MQAKNSRNFEASRGRDEVMEALLSRCVLNAATVRSANPITWAIIVSYN